VLSSGGTPFGGWVEVHASTWKAADIDAAKFKEQLFVLLYFLSICIGHRVGFCAVHIDTLNHPFITMSASKNGMQPMQMQTSASTSGNNGISAKPIIIVLSAVVLGLMALVVGGGVAVYKVIQTHHMNANTLMQLKSVEEMVNTLKVRGNPRASARRSPPRRAR